jgi:hypothetical protein
MNRTGRIRSGLFAGIVAGLVTLFTAGVARAEQTGTLFLSQSRTLTDHQAGAILISASNVTLDCNNFQVRFSPASPGNCGGLGGTNKCGISTLNNLSNVTIRNCHVIGAFGFGIFIQNNTNPRIETSEVIGASTGFGLTGNTGFFGFSLDATNNSNTGYSLIGNTNARLRFSWATGNGGTGFLEQGGTGTIYDQDGRSRDNQLDGYRSQNATHVVYGTSLLTEVGVEASNNQGDGIVAVGTNGVRVSRSVASANGRNGVRFVLVRSEGGEISQVGRSTGNSNGACDAVSDRSLGDVWSSSNSFTRWCGNFSD